MVNPLGSQDPKDFKTNVGNLDKAVNSTSELSWNDRFGVQRKTWHGIEEEANLNIQQAIDAKNAAQEAAMMSGFSKYADTLAILESGIGTDYLEGDVVLVFQDEDRDNTSSIYKVESGDAVFKNAFDKTRQDLLSFTGTISATTEWSDVPAHSDPSFDVQTQPLVNRSEFIFKQATNPSGDDALGGFDAIEKLRDYSGPATSTKLVEGPFAGSLAVDPIDTTSIDNGVTVFVDALGRRWKRTGFSGKITLSMAGGIGGDAAADTAALKKCLDAAAANGYIIDLENKFWKINEVVSGSWAGVKIIGSGNSCGLDFSSGGGFSASSPFLDLPALSELPRKYGIKIKFSSPHGLVFGDVICLRNKTTSSFSNSRAYYYDGQMTKVASVNSDTEITISGVLDANFTSIASTEIVKFTGGQVILDNFHIIPNTSLTTQVVIDGYSPVELNRITADVGAPNTGIYLARCYDYRVGYLDFPATQGSSAYPISVGNSQRGRLTDHASISTRHSIALGGSDYIAAVPVSDLQIESPSLESAGTSVSGAADMHGNVRNVFYKNSVIKTKGIIAGRNSGFNNCIIYGVAAETGSSDIGTCVYGSEFSGGFSKIENCDLISQTPNNPSSGQIHYSIVSDLKDDLVICISDVNIIHDSIGASGLYAMRLIIGANSALTKKIKVVIKNLSISTNATYAAILNISAPSWAADKIEVIMDGIDAPPCSFVTFSNTIGDVRNDVKMRLPAQTVSESVSVASGQTNVIVSTTSAFRHSYPSAENVKIAISCSKDALTTFSGQVGGVTAIPYAYQRRADGVRFGIRPSSASSFTAADSIRITALAAYDSF